MKAYPSSSGVLTETKAANDDLQTNNRICYTTGGKCCDGHNRYAKRPQGISLGAFLFPLIAGGLNP